MAVLLPVVMLVIGLVFQVGLLYHAQNTVNTAAEEAVESAKIEGADEADGIAGADAVLSQTGGLRNITIDVDRGPELVTVTVSGDSPTVLGTWRVTSTAQSPRERFVDPAERQ
jgi:Flp pilus assembly protein TadG